MNRLNNRLKVLKYDIATGSHQARRRPVVTVVVLLIAASLIFFGARGLTQLAGLSSFIDLFIPGQSSNSEISTGVINDSTSTPAETSVDKACDNYKVAAAQPRTIEIPSLGVRGCIQRVGIDAKGRMAVPTNVNLAGWYVHSPLPGARGVSVIDGHSQGRYKPGIFKRIGELKRGDSITIEYGNGFKRNFEVISTDRYTVARTSQEQYRQLAGADSQLTLVTCGGNYDRAAKSYDKRVVVRTKLD